MFLKVCVLWNLWALLKSQVFLGLWSLSVSVLQNVPHKKSQTLPQTGDCHRSIFSPRWVIDTRAAYLSTIHSFFLSFISRSAVRIRSLWQNRAESSVKRWTFLHGSSLLVWSQRLLGSVPCSGLPAKEILWSRLEALVLLFPAGHLGSF